MIRAASLAAGFPNTAGASSVNRFCSSGLKAVQDIANQITLGSIDVGLAVGAESMTHSGDRLNRPFVDEIRDHQEARDCEQPMGQTSENVGADFNITREMQDRFAYESYRKAEVAQKEDWFSDEIAPITTIIKDPKTGEEKTVTLNKDEGPRWGTTYEALAKIRPAFKEFGDRSTGGNSSQVTDGAAAVLLMRRSVAERLGQPIMAKFVNATVAGLAPRIMGIGPSVAIPKLLSKLQITLDEVDVIEINEAFASMGVYCVNKLNIDPNKLNMRGGAIALGHPLGATGARQIVTGLSICRKEKKKILLTSMCIGTVSSRVLILGRVNCLANASNRAKVWQVFSSTNSYDRPMSAYMYNVALCLEQPKKLSRMSCISYSVLSFLFQALLPTRIASGSPVDTRIHSSCRMKNFFRRSMKTSARDSENRSK